MKVVTAVVNNPVFIEIQYHTLKKYFIGDYEFIVFNDAKDFPDFTNGNDVTIKKTIEDKCSELGITCINIPNEQHKTEQSPCIRCADSMNFILKYQKENPDRYLLIDSDMFLIDYFDVNKYAGYDFAFVLQARDNNKFKYVWSGLHYFDMSRLKDVDMMNWNLHDYVSENGNRVYCDVGAMMKDWLKRQVPDSQMPTPEDVRWSQNKFHTENVYFIKHLWSCTWDINELPENLKNHNKLVEFMRSDIRNHNGKFYCEIYDNVFLHYRGGGNWNRDGMDMHNFLTQLLYAAIV